MYFHELGQVAVSQFDLLCYCPGEQTSGGLLVQNKTGDQAHVTVPKCTSSFFNPFTLLFTLSQICLRRDFWCRGELPAFMAMGIQTGHGPGLPLPKLSKGQNYQGQGDDSHIGHFLSDKGLKLDSALGAGHLCHKKNQQEQQKSTESHPNRWLDGIILCLACVMLPCFSPLFLHLISIPNCTVHLRKRSNLSDQVRILRHTVQLQHCVLMMGVLGSIARGN